MREKEQSSEGLKDLLLQVEQVATRISFLSEVSQSLVGALNNKHCFHQLLGLVVPRIADWGLLVLTDENGKAERIVSIHRDLEKGAILAKLERTFVPSLDDPVGPGWAIHHGQTQVIAKVEDEFDDQIKKMRSRELRSVIQTLGANSVLSVPLMKDGRAFGALLLIDSEKGRVLSENDVKLAEDVSKRAADIAFHVLEYFRTTEQIEKLRIQLKLREQLASQARHDVKSILTSALLSAQLIDRTEGEQKHKLAERIIHAVQRSTEILEATKSAEDKDIAA